VDFGGRAPLTVGANLNIKAGAFEIEEGNLQFSKALEKIPDLGRAE
jgi:hypothetical protein